MIRIEHIAKSFGGIVAVDDCSLEIAAGTITGLIGPNGAGKTTLFGIVSGFLPPDSGRVLLDGADVTGLPPHRLFARGLMRTFQIPHVFDRMSVRENLSVVPPGQVGENIFASWFARSRVAAQETEIVKRADAVLEFLGLADLADAPAETLSGGQKKLVELGRTMMSDCKTVLLDEPAAGVNRTLLGQLADRIAYMNRELGYTFCIIEHDMDLVARLCDPVVVMAEGSVLAQGTLDEIRRDERILDAYLGTTPNPGAGP